MKGITNRLTMNKANSSKLKKQPVDVSQRSRGFGILSLEQEKDIRSTISAGFEFSEVAKIYGLSTSGLRKLLTKNLIEWNEERPYTDLDIIFGKRLGKPSFKAVRGFTDFSAEKKANFEYLLKKHEGLIGWAVNHVRYFPIDGDTTEVKQVVRCMLYYNYHRFDPAKNTFALWMASTAVWIIRAYCKRHSGNKISLVDNTKFFDELDSDNPTEPVDGDPNIIALRSAIDSLPAKYRSILELHLEGYGNIAIASMLKVKRDFVNNIIYQTKTSIYECRDRWFSDPEITSLPDKKPLTHNLFKYRPEYNEGINVSREELKKIKRILSKYPVKVAALKLNVSEKKVWYYLARLKMSVVNSVYRKRKQLADDPKTVESVKILLAVHGSIQAVADELDMDRKTVDNIMKKNNIPKPPQKRRSA